ncbi:ABC transporter ATP-binding protein [Rhodococcus sp. X156]|uniref:ABC transporter ATP-binding protein n=1 Tax=Rhodococcus sp. X156 TaxID=2499145 RepID=UPI001F4983BD|nr:ABC transporter ATP-binding protein [Rhodococcus sp. X156]
MNQTTAEVEELEVTFQRKGAAVRALRGVSLTISPGEIVGLVGESGSGKSVLGFSLLGLLPRSAELGGAVRVMGSDMLHGDEKSRQKVRRLNLGSIFQDPMTSLNPTMRVGQQVAESAGSTAEAERLLAAVGIPDPARRMRSYPHELSGGLRQRVMIAMAVAGDPELIVADEPTTALDVTVQAQVLVLLRRLRDELGCSVLMITHDLGVAAQIADRVAVLYAGRIAEVGPAAEVLQAPAHPYTHGLLQSRLTFDTHRQRALAVLPGEVPSPTAVLSGCPFVPRCPLAHDQCSTRPPAPTEAGPGRVSACVLPAPTVLARLHPEEAVPPEDAVPPDAAVPPDEVVAPQTTTDDPARERGVAVSVREVTKAFPTGGAVRGRARLQALRGVSLTVGAGEAVAIVGESGSGKSTLLRVIAGLETPTTGQVGLAATERPQMVFQDAGASLTPWMSVHELVSERLRGRKLSRRQRDARVTEALTRVGLPADVARARAAQLSGGQRQRVSLARATVVPPAVLLCDEPTSALDVSLAASVINLIGQLRESLDMAVVFVTHDLSVARVVADRIAVMYLGRIVEIGDVEQVTARPAHPYTQALIASIPDIGREPEVMIGEPGSPLSPPSGCAFHPRCPLAIATCSEPALDVGLEGTPGSNHRVACIERRAS